MVRLGIPSIYEELREFLPCIEWPDNLASIVDRVLLPVANITAYSVPKRAIGADTHVVGFIPISCQDTGSKLRQPIAIIHAGLVDILS